MKSLTLTIAVVTTICGLVAPRTASATPPAIVTGKPSFFYIGIDQLPKIKRNGYHRAFYISPNGDRVCGVFTATDNKPHYFQWQSGKGIKEIPRPNLPIDYQQGAYYKSYLTYYESAQGKKDIQEAKITSIRGSSADTKTLLGGSYFGGQDGEHPYLWRKSTGVMNIEQYVIKKMGLGNSIKSHKGKPLNRLGRATAISDDGKTIAGCTDGGAGAPDDIWIVHDPKGFAG